MSPEAAAVALDEPDWHWTDPKVTPSVVTQSEMAKYEIAWSLPDYVSDGSPGEYYADMFQSIADSQPGDSVIDLGCGAGRGGKALKEKLDLNVTYQDFVKVDGVPSPFIQQPLWHDLPKRNPLWKYGYCCDVMEHIPSEYVMLVVHNIMAACDRALFSISFVPDIMGKYVGSPLHLTIQPYTWWCDRLAEFGELTEARDMLGQGVFYVKRR